MQYGPHSTRRSAGAVAAIVLASTAQAGTILYVDDDAQPGGDGQSWATAYTFLQDALGFAVGQGGVAEIRVAQGTYKPDRRDAAPEGTASRAATFQLVNGVSLMGGYAGVGATDPDERDPELYVSILSGDLLGDDGPEFANNGENSYHIASASGCDESTGLSGFTLTSGNAFYFGPGSPPGVRNGGALHVSGACPSVSGCVFTGNSAMFAGGGVYVENGASPVLSDCILTGNRSGLYDDGYYGGGAIAGQGASLTVIGCLFTANSVVLPGRGGAIRMTGAVTDALSVTDCVFEGNVASIGGRTLDSSSIQVAITGSVFTNGTYPVRIVGPSTVTACEFVGNTFTALHVSGGSIADCLFHDNDTGLDLFGSVSNSVFTNNFRAIYAAGGEIVGCTIVGNATSNHRGPTASTLTRCSWMTRFPTLIRIRRTSMTSASCRARRASTPVTTPRCP